MKLIKQALVHRRWNSRESPHIELGKGAVTMCKFIRQSCANRDFDTLNRVHY